MDPFGFMYAGVPGIHQFSADLIALVNSFTPRGKNVILVDDTSLVGNHLAVDAFSDMSH